MITAWLTDPTDAAVHRQMSSNFVEGNTMTREQPAHIEPSPHSTDEVDELLRHVEGRVDVSRGAGSPAIKPNLDLGEDGKPDTDTPHNPCT